jgi:16S rRNA (cytosine967-C5)-methyltransferase
MGDVKDRTVLDLCAAPGGKAAQLAAAGARVTAVDKSRGRLARLKDNLQRLGLDAETVVADALTFDPGQTFDFVLLDAPCTSTGTIRRHPDILTLKRIEDIAALASLQAALLARAARLVGPGGTLVYCTCSLEPEEGEDQIAAFLKQNPEFSRRPPSSNGADIPVEWRRDTGDLRTLPTHLSELPEGLQGIDGFYAAVLTRAR